MRTVDLDGARYLVGRIPPRRSLRLQARLIRLVGPGIAQLIAAAKPGKDGMFSVGDLELDGIAAALQGVLAQLTPDEQDAILSELFEHVQLVDNGRNAPLMPVFDAHFQDRLPTVWKLAWEALQENYGSFFGPLAAAASSAAQAFLSGASAKKSSTSGSSGGSS